MTEWLFSKLMIWYVILLHTYWGFVALFDPASGATQSTIRALASTFQGLYALAGLTYLLTSGIAIAATIVPPRRTRLAAFLLAPQQVILTNVIGHLLTQVVLGRSSNYIGLGNTLILWAVHLLTLVYIYWYKNDR